MRKVIGQEEIEAAYSMGKLVFEGKQRLDFAIKYLVTEKNMNKTSATYYVKNFGHFMNGENLEATMNQNTYRYYLNNIEKDYGKEVLKTALKAFRIHLDTNKNWKNKKSKINEAIYNEFLSHCDS